MSTNESVTQERTDVQLTHFDNRPADCGCWDTEADLPCFACHRAGFEAPNPNADEQ